MKKRKVGIIGCISESLDGQTIKTKTLYDELSLTTDWKFYFANTKYKSKHPLKLLLQTIRMLFSCKDIFILVSQNGAKFYFPILFCATKLLKTRVYHDVIGGNPQEYVLNNIRNKNYLNSFKVNWVETLQMCGDLAKVGVNNAEELPNFKKLTPVTEDTLVKKFEYPLPLCTFSRVMKEKGVEEAIDAVEQINREYGFDVYSLDIYGLIDENYKEDFYSKLSRSSPIIKYCGIVPYSESVSTVKNYYALLFPTYWFGEGFPGTIVDAFASGVPVIASDWNSNKEIVENFVSGIVYPNDKIKSLIDCLKWAEQNSMEMIKFRYNCLIEFQKYIPEKYVRKIVERVEMNE